MTFFSLLLALACTEDPVTEETGETGDTDTETVDHDPVTDMVGFWSVSGGSWLPGQSGVDWCADAGPEDYDFMFYSDKTPADCWIPPNSGCLQGLDFREGGDLWWYVHMTVETCEGGQQGVTGFTSIGDWGFQEALGQSDLYLVLDQEWEIRPTGEDEVEAEADGHVFSLVRQE